MPRTQNAKLSFSAGVLSPRLSLRADTDNYSTGLKRSTNFIVSPQGGVVMREGLQNITPASFPTAQNRIFQFHKGGAVSDMLVEVTAGDGLVHFWIDGVKHADTVAPSSYFKIRLFDPSQAPILKYGFSTPAKLLF